MKPLAILLAAFVLTLIVIKISFGNWDLGLSGRIAMAVMVAFTGVAHFFYTKGMEMMLPEFIPAKKFWVYFTGVIEIAAAVGLLLPNLYVLTGWLLILFFVLILPSNIYTAIKKVDYVKATYEGNGLSYLWFRIPLQLFFIAWVYVFAIWRPF